MSKNLHDSASLFDFYFKIEREITSRIETGTTAYNRAYDAGMRQASEVLEKANLISQNRDAYRTYIYTVQETYKEELRDAYRANIRTVKNEVDSYTSKIYRSYADLKTQEEIYAEDKDWSIKNKFNLASTLKDTFSDSINIKHSGKFLSVLSKLLLGLAYFAGFYLLADLVVTALKKSGLFPYDLKILPIPNSTLAELIMLFILCVVVVVIALNILDAKREASKGKKKLERIKESGLVARGREIKKIKDEIAQTENQFATFRKNNAFYFNANGEFITPAFDNVLFQESKHLQAMAAAELKVIRDFDLSVFPREYKFEIKR